MVNRKWPVQKTQNTLLINFFCTPKCVFFYGVFNGIFKILIGVIELHIMRKNNKIKMIHTADCILYTRRVRPWERKTTVLINSVCAILTLKTTQNTNICSVFCSSLQLIYKRNKLKKKYWDTQIFKLYILGRKILILELKNSSFFLLVYFLYFLFRNEIFFSKCSHKLVLN